MICHLKSVHCLLILLLEERIGWILDDESVIHADVGLDCSLAAAHTVDVGQEGIEESNLGDIVHISQVGSEDVRPQTRQKLCLFRGWSDCPTKYKSHKRI